LKLIELLSKTFDFQLILSKQSVFGIFIDYWCVLDVFGPRSIFESR
jgi:hypothetical protein